MSKKQTKLEKFKIWLDENPRIKSALNTFWTGFIAVFLLQIREIEWDNLQTLIEGGAVIGIFIAALRAGLIAGASALGRFLTR